MSIYNYKINCYILDAFYPKIYVPISSVSARIRSGSSYMQVTIPDYDAYAYALSLRSGGNFHVQLKIGSDIWREIFWVDIENIYTYAGARSKSIVLSGHRTFTYSGVAFTREIVDYSFVSTTNKTIIRCGINQNYLLQIGDRAVAGYHADITVEMLTYTINNSQAVLEITGT